MKKVVMSIMVITFALLIVGCIDYKAYDVKPEQNQQEIDLIDEIAQIEKELGLNDEKDSENGEVPATEETNKESDQEVVEEEVTLPDVKKEQLSSAEPKVITVNENELVKLNVKVADPDEDVVTHTFSKPLNSEGMWKTNYGDAGEYLVTLTANDGKLTTEQVVKIVVKRVNVAPTIVGVQEMRVREGALVTFKPTVNDPNGDPVTTTISAPLENGNWKTDHTSAGEYQIKVVASDGELTTEKSFVLTVDDLNVLPEITNLQDINIKEGEVVTIKPIVTDLDEDPITLTISEPVGDDGVWQTTFTDHGTYNIQVVASDGKDKVTKNVKVTVEDVNKAPVFVDISLGTN